MQLMNIPLLDHHREFLNRFVSVCQSDARVLAAFLSGSYVTGTSDAYSDVDLDLITTEAAYEEFCTEKASFFRRLGDLVFVEDWGKPQVVFFNFADDTEGEMMIGRQSQLDLLHRGPHTVLLDKTGILVNADFPYKDADPTEQMA